MFSASKTAAPVSGSFQVSNSLRFRSSASAYLNRTPSVAGNRQTWTLSFWMKIGTNTSNVSLFSNLNSSAVSGFSFDFTPTTFNIYDYTSAFVWQLTTTQVFRDPSAWYHVVFVADTTQATASNRVKLYVNGSQVTAFSTASYPSQNYQALWNTTAYAAIGRVGSYTPSGYFDGYMAEVNFIDGQALTPSSFGSINATTGVWQPAQYTGSYGTNGFYLKFNNGTSTTTLGNDSSGNGNNWTTNNISLTAGSTYDWMIDSPTSYAGSSYGVGNYAVLNPVGGAYSGSACALSQGNLYAVITSTTNVAEVSSTIGVPSGKWYWETNVVSVNTTYAYGCVLGISNQASNGTSANFAVTGYFYNAKDGNKITTVSGSIASSSYGATYTNGDVIGVAFDATAGTLTFYKNGTSQGTAFTGISASTWYARVSSNDGCTVAVNFGQRPFAYTPPSGFKSLCTQNLPAPAIYNGANHMAATTYTGTLLSNAVSNAVNGISFQPDLVWIKSRSAATDHKLTDSVRGVTKGLISNTTGAETTDSQGVTAFGSSGFTVGTNTTYNNLSATYVGWQWKAGGTAVSNTSGTITSSVSANTTAGFSVVTYTGTGANATVGHGLGVAPSMFITKKRSSTSDWGVYHSSLTSAAYYLLLDSTAAQASGATYWNSTAPTSSVFSIGTADPTNISTATYVAYCFAAIAGYSAFGSYTGNGSADGPFVYCGFQPKFVLVKCSSTTGNWYVFDSVRNTYNVLGEQLYPNLSNAGSTATTLDFLSNGFKMRTASDPNASATYIYAAFASSPFQNSLAF